MLHDPEYVPPNRNYDSEIQSHTTIETPRENEQNFVAHVAHNKRSLLATALVPLFHKCGTKILFRALIDQGSMSNIISERAAQQLELDRYPVNIPITSLGNSTTGFSKFKVVFEMGSSYNSKYQYKNEALILKTITYINPTHSPINNNWDHLKHLPLADPKHYKPGQIDLLIGAETYAEIILHGLVKGPEGTPMAQNTKIGWIISGPTHGTENQIRSQCNFTNNSDDK